MIKVNVQLGGKFNGKVNAENFPRLFNPFKPTERISNCSIKLNGDDIDIQTIITDTNQLIGLVNDFIKAETEKANAEIVKAQRKLATLQQVDGDRPYEERFKEFRAHVYNSMPDAEDENIDAFYNSDCLISFMGKSIVIPNDATLFNGLTEMLDNIENECF